jgi:Domain of unknown function (DUF4349)
MAVAGARELFRVRRWRARRVWLTGAVTVLAVLTAGLAVLAWPVERSATGTAVVEPSYGGGRSAVAPDAGGSNAAGPEPGAADQAAPAPESAAVPQASRDGVPRQVPGVPIGGTGRQLVRTAQLTVEVGESVAATRQVRTTAAAAGGMVVEEQSGDRGSWLVLRVPSDTLDRVIDDVAAIGRVTARTSQVTDSTAEVVDLDARVASQQASVARVRALLAQATSIGDVVAVEAELARREADLDSLTNQLAALRDQVAMSTLTVDLRMPPTPVVDDPRAAGFSDGLAAGWRGLVALGTAVAAVLGFLLPFLPVIAVVVGLAWAARRIVRGRRVVAAGAGGPGAVGES